VSWFSSATPFAVIDSVDYLQLLKDKMTLWIGKEAVTHGKCGLDWVRVPCMRDFSIPAALASFYSVVYHVLD